MQAQKSQIAEVLMPLNGKTLRQGNSEEDWKENNSAARRDRNNSLSRGHRSLHMWKPETGGCQSHSLLDYVEREKQSNLL